MLRPMAEAIELQALGGLFDSAALSVSGALVPHRCFFGVHKRGGHTRLIMDTRSRTFPFLEPPHTELPTSSAFSRIESDEAFPP